MSGTAAEALEAAMDAVLPPPSLRAVALAALLVLLVGVGGLVGWAVVTPLERAVLASGSLAAEGRRKTITLLEPGILRELLVREGDLVATGQPLLRLDITQAEAAQRAGISQPRMNDLVKGRTHKFTLDALVNVAAQLGYTVKLSVKRAA